MTATKHIWKKTHEHVSNIHFWKVEIYIHQDIMPSCQNSYKNPVGINLRLPLKPEAHKTGEFVVFFPVSDELKYVFGFELHVCFNGTMVNTGISIL